MPDDHCVLVKESHCSGEEMLPGRVSADNSSEDNSSEDNSSDDNSSEDNSSDESHCSEESHCSSDEEMLPVRVSAANCRGGAVSSAR